MGFLNKSVTGYKREITDMLNLTKYKVGYKRVGYIFLILLFSMGTYSFISAKFLFESESHYQTPEIDLPEPVNFDFEEILERGTIRVITRYDYDTYFLYRGYDRGFEYEFVSRFAKEHGLKIEVVLTHSDEEAIEMLNRGDGDLIAKKFVINPERASQVSFSKPYDLIDNSMANQCIISHPDENGNTFSIPQFIEFEKDTVAWAMRKNAPLLKLKADDFIQKHFRFREGDSRTLRSAYLNLLRRRYFEDESWRNRFSDPKYNTMYTGYLSPYDEMVKSIADEAGVDWKLVIAVMAQESAFNPNAESWAGALGLMQIIPRFSVVENEALLYDPETNIREGVRYLREHLRHNAHLDSLNQHSMALAMYNVGSGHLSDARRLADQLGNNPDEWNHVADALLKLMHPEYYRHARFGYKRGTETVNYVKDVLNRYDRYQTVYEWAGYIDTKMDERIVQINQIAP